MTQNDMPDSADLAPTPAPDCGALEALDEMRNRTFMHLLQLGVPENAPVFTNLRKESELIRTALITKKDPAPKEGEDDENKRLRGVLKYIQVQAEAAHPQALIVIAMNAKEALER